MLSTHTHTQDMYSFPSLSQLLHTTKLITSVLNLLDEKAK